MRTLVASPFEDDAAEILDCYNHIAGFMMRDRIYSRGERIGQAFMNTLAGVDPEGFVRITDSDVDPFYDDSKIPAALDLLTRK